MALGYKKRRIPLLLVAITIVVIIAGSAGYAMGNSLGQQKATINPPVQTLLLVHSVIYPEANYLNVSLYNRGSSSVIGILTVKLANSTMPLIATLQSPYNIAPGSAHAFIFRPTEKLAQVDTVDVQV